MNPLHTMYTLLETTGILSFYVSKQADLDEYSQMGAPLTHFTFELLVKWVGGRGYELQFFT